MRHFNKLLRSKLRSIPAGKFVHCFAHPRSRTARYSRSLNKNLVIVTPKALKQYSHLPKAEQAKIKKKLLALEQSPQEGKKLTGDYSELRSLRAWPYRIIYYIDDRQKKIFIVTIAHRQEVYSH